MRDVGVSDLSLLEMCLEIELILRWRRRTWYWLGLHQFGLARSAGVPCRVYGLGVSFEFDTAVGAFPDVFIIDDV